MTKIKYRMSPRTRTIKNVTIVKIGFLQVKDRRTEKNIRKMEPKMMAYIFSEIFFLLSSSSLIWIKMDVS